MDRAADFCQEKKSCSAYYVQLEVSGAKMKPSLPAVSCKRV